MSALVLTPSAQNEVEIVPPNRTNILPHAGDLTFREELEGLQPAVDSLISLGVNKIVALGHSGYDKALDIANNLEGVDVVVSGRDFTLLYTGNRLWLDRACS